jgi:predicted glycosyltransferase involved in capsule biosynthesis
MVLTKEKPSGGGWYKRGKMLNVSCEIFYDGWSELYHFITRKENVVYNSIWDNVTFKTEDECKNACMDYVKRIAKGG